MMAGVMMSSASRRSVCSAAALAAASVLVLGGCSGGAAPSPSATGTGPAPAPSPTGIAPQVRYVVESGSSVSIGGVALVLKAGYMTISPTANGPLAVNIAIAGSTTGTGDASNGNFALLMETDATGSVRFGHLSYKITSKAQDWSLNPESGKVTFSEVANGTTMTTLEPITMVQIGTPGETELTLDVTGTHEPSKSPSPAPS